MKRIFVHIPKNGGMTYRKNPNIRNQIILATPNMHVSKEYTRKLHEVMHHHGEHEGNEHARYIDWNEDKVVDTIVKEYDWEKDTVTKTNWRIGDGTA